MHVKHIITVLAVLLIATACGRGYLSAEALESGQISPRHCAQTCTELGLEMGAFVLVQHGYAGCVCQPTRTAGAEVAGGGAVDAAATVAIVERRRESQQRQQSAQN